MQLDHFTEEPASSSGGKTTQHYLYNKDENLVIQATPEGFRLRDELWLRSYLQTVLSGQPLPGFSYFGKIEVSDGVIRPMIDGLSYKAFVEQKLTRINRAIAVQGTRIIGAMPNLNGAAIGS